MKVTIIIDGACANFEIDEMLIGLIRNTSGDERAFISDEMEPYIESILIELAKKRDSVQ